MKVADIIKILDSHAPFESSEPWDLSGLFAGDTDADVSNILVSLDLTAFAIEKARDKKASCIVVYHPPLFPKAGLLRGFTREESPLLFECVRSGIAVVGVHTCFDRSATVALHNIAESLGALPDARFLSPNDLEFLKLVVYVPKDHLDKVRNALGEAGAGKIGLYDHCSFFTEGEGSFRALQGAQPFTGAVGKVERVKECRLEVVLPKTLRGLVSKALRSSHPYEEIAHEWLELEKQSVPAYPKGFHRGLGYGFAGNIKSIPIEQFLAAVSRVFKVPALTVTHPNREAPVSRVGFVPGAGGDFVKAALGQGCQWLITGEMSYHRAKEAAFSGLGIVLIGHAQSEHFFYPTLKKWLEDAGFPPGGLFFSEEVIQAIYFAQ